MKQPKQILLCFVIIMALESFGSAHALVIEETSTINWSGTCPDCTGPLGSESPAHAILEVATLGNTLDGTATDTTTAFGLGNLVGFSYWSALFPSGLVALPGSISLASGVIPLVGPPMADNTNVFVAAGDGGYWMFSTYEIGRWELAMLEEERLVSYDVGVLNVFGAVAVPEPGTFLLTTIGLVTMRLRKNRTQRTEQG